MSCSAMPSYFVAMAVHRGWLLKRLLRVGERPSLAGWRRDEAQGNGGRELKTTTTTHKKRKADLGHNNNNVHLLCAHQRPGRSHDTY